MIVLNVVVEDTIDGFVKTCYKHTTNERRNVFFFFSIVCGLFKENDVCIGEYTKFHGLWLIQPLFILYQKIIPDETL